MKFQFKKGLLRGLCILALILFAGCSQMDLGIRWADTALAYRINSEFNLKGPQKQAIKEETGIFIEKIRRTELPRIATFLKEGARELETLPWSQPELTSVWIERTIKTIESYQDALLQILQPYAVAVSKHIQKKNWEHYLAEFEKENGKIAGRQKKCTDRMKSTLKEWIGPLNESQRKSVLTYCEVRPNSAEIRIANRRHQLAQFQSEMPAGFSSDGFVLATQKWIATYPSRQHPEHKALWAKSRPALIRALTEILGNSTEKQRKKLRESILERAETLQRLSL
jgi:hypothetical protein